VGPGRGAFTGSIVAFALRISAIDPVEFDLLFERFLDAEGHPIPQIEIEFGTSAAASVREYLGTRHRLEQCERTRTPTLVCIGQPASAAARK